MSLKEKSLLLVTLTALLLSGCAISPSTPPPAETNTKSVQISPKLFIDDDAIMNTYQIGETNYYISQTRGGSLFLGPIVGAMNIRSETAAMSEKAQGSYVEISIQQHLQDSLEEHNILVDNNSVIALKPFFILQRSVYDDYRLSLYTQAKQINGEWTGQYAYHMQMTIPLDKIGNATPEEIEAFKTSLKKATDGLAKLIADDMSGKIEINGPQYDVGSLNLHADRIGATGIYTQPEELYIRGAIFVGMEQDNKLIRFKGRLGFSNFGLHSFEPGLIHTFNPTN